MRDFVLAERFSTSEVAFATRALRGNLDELIDTKGFAHHSLKDNKPKRVIKILKKNGYDMLVIDHYGIDAAFEREIKKALPELTLMVLDDTYEKHHCDILLNHNIYAKKKHYKNLVPKKTQLLCGAEHTLLREEFLTPRLPTKKDSILIAMGGSDAKNLMLKILRLLPDTQKFKINIITTNANKNLSSLQTYTKCASNVTLHVQTQEVATLARSAHFAIITPSGFANELYSLRVPFIAIESAKNQELMSVFLRKQGFGVLKRFSKKAFLRLFDIELQKALL